jgi:hypothetical protein
LAAAGLATVVPALLPTLAAGSTTEPRTDATTSGSTPVIDTFNGAMTEPLVAHIRDLSTGEIGLFSGDDEFVIHDRQLARSLYAATR